MSLPLKDFRLGVTESIDPPKHCVQAGWYETYSCHLHKAKDFKDQRVPLFRRLWPEHNRSRYRPHVGGGQR